MLSICSGEKKLLNGNKRYNFCSFIIFILISSWQYNRYTEFARTEINYVENDVCIQIPLNSPIQCIFTTFRSNKKYKALVMYTSVSMFNLKYIYSDKLTQKKGYE